MAFYEGVLPSELAVQSLHERLGLTITTAPEDDNGLCPAPGHPDQGDVTYLGPNDTDPVCTNDSLLANPWDNPYVCPNNTVHAGTVYDTTDPAGYAQCGKTIKPTPTPQPATTPAVTSADVANSLSAGQCVEGLATIGVMGLIAYGLMRASSQRRRP